MGISKINLNDDEYYKLLTEHSNKFNSTMLDIVRKRTEKIHPSTILKNYERRASFYQPSSENPIIYNYISNDFYRSISNDFECVELSPINSIGLNSILTLTSQNNVLSTLRNSEVVSDSSILMALECAYRIKNGCDSNINLASSARLLRMQNYGNGKKSHWTQHFRACSLVSSFRNVNNNVFDALILQINNWIKVIKSMELNIESIDVNVCYIPLIKEIYKLYGADEITILNNSVNPDFDVFNEYNINLKNKFSSLSQIEKINFQKDCLLSIKNSFTFIEEKILSKLRESNTDVNFNFHLNRKSGLNYYRNICYEIVVDFSDKKNFVLVDGGVTDWTGKLLSVSKENCVTSGMGLEYMSKVYRKVL